MSSGTLAELHALCAEYTEVAFPGAEAIERMSEREITAGSHRMVSLALRITDLVIDAGLHRGEALK